MAMILFTVLNGLAAVFMLYVLVQFVKEGRRSKTAAGRQYENGLSYLDKPEVFIVTRPISRSARAGLSVIPMRAQKRSLHGEQVHRDSVNGTIEMPLTRRERKNIGACQSK